MKDFASKREWQPPSLRPDVRRIGNGVKPPLGFVDRYAADRTDARPDERSILWCRRLDVNAVRIAVHLDGKNKEVHRRSGGEPESCMRVSDRCNDLFEADDDLRARHTRDRAI